MHSEHTHTPQKLIVTDAGNHRLREIDLTTRSVTTLIRPTRSSTSGSSNPAGHTNNSNPNPNLNPNQQQCEDFQSPGSLVFDRCTVNPESVCWIVANGGIFRYVRATGSLCAHLTGAGGVSSLRTDAVIDCLSSSSSAGGGVPVLIVLNWRTVYSFDPLTGRMDFLAGEADAGGFVDNTSGEKARFSWPRGMVVVERERERERCIYVADTQNHCIRRVTLPASLFL